MIINFLMLVDVKTKSTMKWRIRESSTNSWKSSRTTTSRDSTKCISSFWCWDKASLSVPEPLLFQSSSWPWAWGSNTPESWSSHTSRTFCSTFRFLSSWQVRRTWSLSRLTLSSMWDSRWTTKTSSMLRDSCPSSWTRCALLDTEREETTVPQCISRDTWKLSWATLTRWRELITPLKLCFMLSVTSERNAFGTTSLTWCRWCKQWSRTTLSQISRVQAHLWSQEHAGSTPSLVFSNSRTMLSIWLLLLRKSSTISIATILQSKLKQLSPSLSYLTIKLFKRSLDQLSEMFSKYSSRSWMRSILKTS